MTSARFSALVKKVSQAQQDIDTLLLVCRDIALEVVSGRAKIHTVVEELGPYLTSTDVTVRSNGVKALSIVLEKLPKDYLDESEIQLLTAFYRDRLKDHHNIGPATILGILAIVRMKNLSGDAPSPLFHDIFQNIRCQSELQETRRNIYRIFQVLLENHADDLKSMGPDLIYGVISAIDGECDPRNLMLLFGLLPTFVNKFPLGHLTEEMFEVVACYFPIDFNASSITGEKRKKITREDLAAALAPCLYAIPQFAEFCVPHAMEKLDSDRKVAKIDSLMLLSRGASRFGSSGLRHHLDELWPMLKKEVTSGSDQEVKNAALGAVSAVVSAIAEDDEELRKSFVERIITDTRWSLSDAQLSLYWPAEKLLEAVATTGANTWVQVQREIVPLCLGQYSTKTWTNDKVTLMETLNNFIRIGANFDLTISDIPELAWTDIPGLYLNELGSGDNALKTKTLSGLIIQKFSLKEGQRLTVYDNLCDIVESDIVGELRNTCHSTLFAFGKLYPKEMLEVLNKRLRIDADNVDAAILIQRLEATSILAKIPEIGTVVIPKILEIATAKDSKIASTALSCMSRLLESKNIGDFDIHDYLHERCNAIDRLMSLDAEKLMPLVSSVCRSIIRKLDAKNQQTLVEKYLGKREDKLDERKILLLEGLLTGLRLNVIVEVAAENLLVEFFEIAVKTDVAAHVRQSACKILAAMINKIKEDATFARILRILRERIIDILEADDNETGRKRAAIGLHTWITKSLLTRGSPDSQDFLDYQINILRMEAIGELAPEEFEILVDRSENTLTEENFCRIKIFYKQRIFQNVVQSSGGFFDVKSRQNYLVALAHLVEQVPIELPIMHLEALVPLLIESLSLDNGQLLSSTLKTLKVLLTTKHEIFLDQIQCFIPRCLQLSTHNKMNVRIAALDCLVNYCDYPVVELLKHKEDVLEKLAEALDDHKRLVRQIAVRARTRWYLIGAPGTSD